MLITMKKILALAIVLIAFSQVSFAGRIYVRKENTVNPTPADRTFETIGAGLNNGVIQNGDTVIIYEGTYPEKINFRQNNVNRRFVIGSQYLLDGDKSHIAKTIIDASDISQSNEWNDAIIANYTATNTQTDVQVIGITLSGVKRFGVYMGGGIIKACIFKDNGLNFGYNFMWINNTTVDSCTFENNKAQNLIVSQNAWNAHKRNTIKNSVFKNNILGNSIDYSLILLGYDQDALVQNCLFYKNTNGSIFQGSGQSDPSRTGTNRSFNDSSFVSNCLVLDNNATVASFRSWERNDGGTFYFLNNIISKNSDYWVYRGGNGKYTFGFYNNYSTADLTKAKQVSLPELAAYYEKDNFYKGKIIFKDSASQDYHLTDSSFGLNLGKDTLGVIESKDFDGITRPNPAGSKIDLGPFENLNSISTPNLLKATPGQGRVYLNWQLNQNSYDSIQVFRSLDSLGNNYTQIGSAAKSVQESNSTTNGTITNPSNYYSAITYGNSTYYLSKTRKSWTEARKQAQSDGGDLVSFEDKAEFDYVMAEYIKYINESVWVGLYQINKSNEPKGNFVWTNGLEMAQGYTKNFGTAFGEPNNSGGSEDYVEAYKDWMNDLSNGAGRFFLVEVNKNTESSSVDFIDSSVVNNTKYFYKLKTKINEGNLLSGFSNVKGAKPSAGYPLPNNISLTASSRMVKIKWSNPATEKKGTGSYKIFSGTDPDQLVLVKTVTDKDSSYIDSNKVIGKTYYYRMKSVDADGVESDLSASTSIKITSFVYISTTGTEKGFGSDNDAVATFNQALSIASSGDTIIFKSGTHSFAEAQRITKDVVVASNYIISKDTNDINNTIITSGNGIGTAFTSGNVSKSFIGLTFQNNPGGVFSFENVTVDNCRFNLNGTYNNRTVRFIGVYNNSSVSNSRFLNNYGTIELSGSGINIKSNYFEGNIFGNRTNTNPSWFITGWYGKVNIENNIFIKNGEYVKQTWGEENETSIIGIDGWGDTTFVSNNTFISNDAAAIAFRVRNRSAVVVNNIFYKNKVDFSFAKLESWNNNQFLYSNISNNIINQELNTFPNINNYAYSPQSKNNLVNPQFGFKDLVTFRIGNSSAAIGAGVKTIAAGGSTIFTAPSNDYYGNNRANDKIDIGAEQTPQRFPAPNLIGDAKDKSAVLTWNKSNAGITGYKIFRSTSPIPDTATVVYKTETNPNTLTLNESSLTNLSKYYYRIQAYDGSNNSSGLSNEVLIRPNTVPAKLESISVAGGPRNATITWTKKAAVFAYTIYKGIKSDSLLEIAGPIDSAYFVDSDVKAGQDYFYGVKVTDSIGVKSDMSNVIKVTPSNIQYVDTSSKAIQNGSKAYPFITLADAIANTSNGDTVIVRKGRQVITETIRYSKNITLASEWILTQSEKDIDSTVITTTEDIGWLLQKNNQNFNPTLKIIGLNFKENQSRLFYTDLVYINKCIFENNGSVGNRGRYFLGLNTRDTVENSVFRNNNGYIEFNGTESVIRKNKFLNNLYGGIGDAKPLFGGWVAKIRFENNYFVGNGIYYKQPWDDFENAVIRVEGYDDTTIVANNTFINNNAVAVQFNPSNKKAIVVNNLFYNNKEDFAFTKFQSWNNNTFSYSNISNNFLNKALDKYSNINSYSYRTYSSNNVLNGINAFVDTIDYKLSTTSGAIGLGAKLFRTNNMQVYTALGTDYFGNTYGDKIDIGAHQTTYAFPAPSLNEVEGGDGKVKVSWIKSSKLIKGYSVFRSQTTISDTSSLSPIKTIDKPDSLFILDAGTNGTRYYYRVKAYDSSATAKFSGFSNELSVVPNTPPAKVNAFLGEAGPRLNYLSWERKDTSLRYNLYRGVSQDSLIVVARNLSSATFIDRNLEVNKEYFYALKVTDKGGAASDLSDVLALKTTNILYVDTTVGTVNIGTSKLPFNNIQAAINASMDGDTILVKPGIYNPIRITNKAIVVRSTSGPSKTFINSTLQTDFYVVRVDGNDNDARPYKSIQVEGFTIYGLKNWRSGDWQGTISIRSNVSPVFKNNIVKDVENNHTISVDQSAPLFINNLFINNKGHFLNLGWNDSTSANAKYKMPRFVNCTFTKTQNWGNNGGHSVAMGPFINCIFWGNDPSSQITGSHYSIRNSLVEYQDFENKNGNFRLDPLFINEDLDDYRLSNSSPALGKGVSGITVAGQLLTVDSRDLLGYPRPGPDSTKPDLGAYENPYSFAAPVLSRLQKFNNQVKLTFKYDKTLDVSKLILFRDTSAVKLDTLSIALKDISKDSITVTDNLTESQVYSYALRSVVNGVNSGISNILNTNDTTYVPEALFESDTASLWYRTIDAGVPSFVNMNGMDYNYPSVIIYDNRWKSGDRSNKSPNDSIYFIKTVKSDKAKQSVKLLFDKQMHITLGASGDQMQVLGPINLDYNDEFDMAAVVQKSGQNASAGNLLYNSTGFSLLDSLDLRYNTLFPSLDTSLVPTFNFNGQQFDYNSWSRSNTGNIMNGLDMIDGNFDGKQEHIVTIRQLKWVPKFKINNSNCRGCIESAMKIVKFVDLNKDGLKDLIGITGDNWQVGYPNQDGNSVHVFVSNKTLGQYEMYRTGLFIEWNSSLFIEDYNNDGRPDILCRSRNQINYSIYELNNDYSYKESLKALTVASPDEKITSGDINNDGYNDVVTISTNGFLNVYLNDQKNGFKLNRYIIPFRNSNQSNLWNATRLRLIDMNGDGFKDIFWYENIWTGSFNMQRFKTIIQTPGELALGKSALTSTSQINASNDGYNVKIKWNGFSGPNSQNFKYNIKVDTAKTYSKAILNTGFNYKKSNPQIPIVLDQITSSLYKDSVVFKDPNISKKFPYYIAIQAVTESGIASDYKEVSFIPKDPLSQQSSTIPGMTNARFAWGDYNNDGQLDLAVIGLGDENVGQVLKIYKNDNGKLIDLQLTNKQLKEGDVKWVDIDKDGWLDLIATGQSGSVPTTVLFKNNEGIFEISYPTSIPPLKNSRMSLGDYDNNGTTDLIIMGQDAVGVPKTYLLNNDGRGNFSIVNDFNSKGVMPDLYNGEVRLIDYDLDGDLDLIYTGTDQSGNPRGGIRLSSLLDDQNSRFNTYFTYGLDLKNARFDLGDVDSDGDLDIIVMGTVIQNTLEKPVTKIVRNFSADSKKVGNYSAQNI
ncbi:MAG: FG-GAP-like repeat-containing protein [Bacteroidota bacterium]